MTPEQAAQTLEEMAARKRQWVRGEVSSLAVHQVACEQGAQALRTHTALVTALRELAADMRLRKRLGTIDCYANELDQVLTDLADPARPEA